MICVACPCACAPDRASSEVAPTHLEPDWLSSDRHSMTSRQFSKEQVVEMQVREASRRAAVTSEVGEQVGSEHEGVRGSWWCSEQLLELGREETPDELRPSTAGEPLKISNNYAKNN